MYNEKVEIEVIKGKELLDRGMNLIHAVGRANVHEPIMVDLVFKNDKDSNKMVSLIGKGVVFDSGGLNIK